jgi:electron transfer flavoprotein beta subunit
MRIVVCIKQVPNPEIAASQYRVDEQARTVAPVAGVQLMMSPFDEQAVEAALRIRDAHPAAKITLVSLGPESARNVIKHGLAMGADEGILLADPAFAGSDGYTAALTLAVAIKRIGRVDLVLTGRQAADRDGGVVGAGIGELLGVPVITFAKEVRIEEGVVRVERVLDDGSEIVEAQLPAVVTVSNEIGAPRAPSLRETMRAARKPVAAWSASDLGLAPKAVGAAGARRILERMFIPLKQNRCELIVGNSPVEQAAGLALKLREAKLI